MATISIDIPDQHVTRVLNAFAAKFNYDNDKLDGETKAQFAKRWLADYIKKITLIYEAELAYDDVITNSEDPGIS